MLVSSLEDTSDKNSFRSLYFPEGRKYSSGSKLAIQVVDFPYRALQLASAAYCELLSPVFLWAGILLLHTRLDRKKRRKKKCVRTRCKRRSMSLFFLRTHNGHSMCVICEGSNKSRNSSERDILPEASWAAVLS